MRLVTGLAARAIGLAGGMPLLVWPLLASLAVAGWGHWRSHSARTELAELQAAVARSDAAAQAEYAQRLETIQEVTRHANQSRTRLEADRRGLADTAQRLRQRIASNVQAACAAAAAGGPGSDEASRVLADMRGRVEAFAGAVVEYGDAAGIASETCERAWPVRPHTGGVPAAQ